MRSVIFRTAARILLPVMLLLSIVVLIRGHNEPGGGFVGGLLAATGFALYALAIRVRDAKRALRISPSALIGAGLVLAIVSGLPALLGGRPYMQGLWLTIGGAQAEHPLKIGTPLLFDIGVYLVVVGATLLMVFTLGASRRASTVCD